MSARAACSYTWEPPSLFFISSLLFLYRNANLLQSTYIFVMPSGGIEGHIDPTIYSSLLTCISLASFLNNNPLALLCRIFQVPGRGCASALRAHKEKPDQHSARSLWGLVIESRKILAKRHFTDLNQPLGCPHVCFYHGAPFFRSRGRIQFAAAPESRWLVDL